MSRGIFGCHTCGGGDPAKHHIVYRTAFATKNDPVSNVSGAKVEKQRLNESDELMGIQI